MSDQYGGGPGPYGGSFGQPSNPYSYQPGPVSPPKQVTIAAAISLGMGGLCILVSGFALTSAGEKMAEMLTDSKDAQEVLAAAFLFCAVAYILPGLFLRKRHPWARIMLIIIAAIGISGGASALPGSLLGLALHTTLLVLLLQQPSKLWFRAPRR